MTLTGHTSTRKMLYWGSHYLMIAAFVIFALFPLYWLLKVSVTPNDILYTEGVRMWPSRTTWDNYTFVLTQSNFPHYFMNSVIVAGTTAAVTTVIAALTGYSRQGDHCCPDADHADVPAGHADRADL